MSKNKEHVDFLFDDLVTGQQEDYLEENTVASGGTLKIQDEMAAADLRNLNFMDELSPDFQKQLVKSMYTNMRWFSSVADSSAYAAYQLIITNEILNVNYTEISKHPELFWKLMAACGSGKKLYHNWIPPAKRKRKISAIDTYFLQWYPSANDVELDIITKSLTRDDFEEFVKSTGAPDDELKELLKAYDAENGKPAKAKKDTSEKVSKKRKV